MESDCTSTGCTSLSFIDASTANGVQTPGDAIPGLKEFESTRLRKRRDTKHETIVRVRWVGIYIYIIFIYIYLFIYTHRAPGCVCELPLIDTL